jgi:plasmid stabilization system protein ParE
MTYRIIIEPTAKRDIRAAVRWKTQHASPTVAARWYNGLIKKIGTLHRHPREGKGGGEGKGHVTDIDSLWGQRASETGT